MYLEAVRRRKDSGTGEPEKLPGVRTGAVWGKFVALLVSVMLLGIWMARIGEEIVVATRLSQTFTGALLLGFSTSLPEIIVTFVALNAGSVDMSVGNILGSNLFDICIIPLLDLLSIRPILGMITTGQMLVTGLVLAQAVLLVFGLYKFGSRKRRVGWDTFLIFAVGFFGFVLLYFLK